MTVPDTASIRQIQAADPAQSVWLGANAGSGKTRVLTDRVARLLVDGTDPQNILCLTYTKAAAAEMQNRLFDRLGKWAMLPDADLRADLAALGVTGSLDRRALGRARTLFAQAMEVPGGLRIQTIHAFCAGLLRRFPLESGLGPGFREMEDVEADRLRHEVTDAMAAGADRALFDGLAEHYTGGKLPRFLAEIDASAAALTPPADEAKLRLALDLSPVLTRQSVAQSVLRPDSLNLIRRLVPALLHGSTNDRKVGEKLAPLLADMEPRQGLSVLMDGLLVLAGTARKNFPTKDTLSKSPWLTGELDALLDLTNMVLQARADQLSLQAMERSLALHRFAAAWLPRLRARKQALGLVGFDDLILRARALLTDRSVAQWVLFRLDGGLDHILVDEAQDTSPPQWDVIERLTQEFAAGQGARPDQRRTIFVVGDRKQSIYSFQGADPAAFDRMEHHFRDRLAGIGQALTRQSLEHSFRSSPAILRAVDLTFASPANRGLGDSPANHLAFHGAMPGRVDLWPTVEPAPKAEDAGHWTDPVDRTDTAAPHVVLANHIADRVRAMLDGEGIPDQKDGSGALRPIRPADILILVRRRSQLFASIISALKQAQVPVAGADKLKLGAELAVRDIAAVLHFLALPDDDLSLACALRSPLLGWSEPQLYALAQPRPAGQTLWAALRGQRDQHPATLALLDDLRAQSGFLRPYDLINRILLRHDGRRRLISRLGAEAEDGIDELLSQALIHERGQVPDLTGFLAALQTEDVTAKRPMDTSQNLVRVMTVHGAKGLESPIVILPDTAVRRPGRQSELLVGDPVLWSMKREVAPAAIAARIDARDARDEDERRRLLYVAMTRAERWLIVAAAGAVGAGEDSWHAMVQAGLAHAGAAAAAMPTGPGLRLEMGDWAGAVVAQADAKRPAVLPASDWAPLDPPLPGLQGRGPSDLGGAKVLPGESDPDAGDSALARGRLVHALLEYLPDLPPADRTSAARALAAGVEGADVLTDTERLITDVQALLDSPTRRHLFEAGRAEVALTANVPDLNGERLTGSIDRLIVTENTVTAIDYKTNRLVPDDAARVPEGILRQMGAYHAMLEQIYPGRDIRLAILWVSTGGLMRLTVQECRAALRRAAG